jgi:toxin-antitoxin system PIN domain toxin
MSLVDVNVLVYAAFETSPFYRRANGWLNARLNDGDRLGLPWESILGFVRIAANPRISIPCATVAQAWRTAKVWLDSPNVWTPSPTPRHREILQRLMDGVPMTHKLVSDAHLAAIAIGHNLALVSADTDFLKFPGLHYDNPLAD